MTELYPSDSDLNALSGTAESEQEVLYVATGESPYYTSFYKMLYRLLDVARRGGDLRVYKDGDLTFGVRAGQFFNGDSQVNYASATEQSLTNNATNYIYLTADGTLTVNTTGFPVPSVTPHIPLASVTTSAGTFDHSDITDCRGRAIFNVCGSGNSNLNLLDWQESVSDELDLTSAEPASPAIGERYLNIATGTSSETSQSVTTNYIYQWNGSSWTEVQPTEGNCCLVEDRDMLIGFNGSNWIDIGSFALLNEAQTFFNATDISGSEAETLTDGSNADPLHLHGTTGLADDAVTKEKVNADVAGTGLEQHTDGTLRLASQGNGIAGGAGSTLSIQADATGGANLAKALNVSSNGVAIKVDDSTIQENGSDQLEIKDGGITSAKLASSLQNLLPNINLTGTDDADGTGTMAIQIRDTENNNLSQRFLIRTWIADVDFSEPDPQTDFSVLTGEVMRELETDADYEIITDANGYANMNIDVASDKTVYVMAELDGRVYSGSIAITGN